MDVNARHVNDYIWEAVVYMPITWILYRTELYVHKMDCDGIWVMAQWGLISKPLSRKFRLKYLSNPYTIDK